MTFAPNHHFNLVAASSRVDGTNGLRMLTRTTDLG
jgi:hypothetical protein